MGTRRGVDVLYKRQNVLTLPGDQTESFST